MHHEFSLARHFEALEDPKIKKSTYSAGLQKTAIRRSLGFSPEDREKVYIGVDKDGQFLYYYDPKFTSRATLVSPTPHILQPTLLTNFSGYD